MFHGRTGKEQNLYSSLLTEVLNEVFDSTKNEADQIFRGLQRRQDCCIMLTICYTIFLRRQKDMRQTSGSL
jgi:hypothetical protein